MGVEGIVALVTSIGAAIVAIIQAFRPQQIRRHDYIDRQLRNGEQNTTHVTTIAPKESKS